MEKPMSTISGIGFLDNSNPTQQNAAAGGISTTNPNSQLGEEQFLNLLVAQLKNQDPLQPLSNTDFIAQLATFSSLEKLTSIDSILKQHFGSDQSTTASQGIPGVSTK
ncbi:MAG: flagellar hook capping FlgD N-terminal domain-containing protein [Terriglobia bacterium]